MSESDSTFNLIGTEASRTDVDMAGRTIDDCFHALHVGLPSSVGASMRMGHLNTERNALAANIALCQTAAPPIVGKIVKIASTHDAAKYITRDLPEMQEKKYKKIYFFHGWLRNHP